MFPPEGGWPLLSTLDLCLVADWLCFRTAGPVNPDSTFLGDEACVDSKLGGFRGT
jgi:hypothetical protein